jgi:hypothetical protein
MLVWVVPEGVGEILSEAVRRFRGDYLRGDLVIPSMARGSAISYLGQSREHGVVCIFHGPTIVASRAVGRCVDF